MSPTFTLARRVVLSTTLLAVSSLAHAQGTAAPAADDALTWNGITLSGVIDVGLQYDNHSAPANDFLTYTVNPLIQKYSDKSVTSLVSNPLSNSRVALGGIHAIGGDFSAVFRLETYFEPTSGQITNALKSLAQNNGKVTSSNADSTTDGQFFQVSYLGVTSPTYGTLTFGRQNTPLLDGIQKYDIMEDGVDAANAFSLIGNSRVAAGGGDTENSRLDRAIRYAARFQSVHVGLLYQLSGATGSSNTDFQAQIGFDVDKFSIDAFYAEKKDAISAAALSAAQVTALPAEFSVNSSLAGTISDNTAYALMASYDFGRVKISGGWDHLRFADPSNPLTAGAVDAGYELAFVTNNAYIDNKVLDIFWAGAKFILSQRAYIAASYYGYHQNSYATGANAGCSSSTIAGSCSGNENAFGLLLDYRWSRHFDSYAGGLYSEVSGGLANGFIVTEVLALTTGLRFKF